MNLTSKIQNFHYTKLHFSLFTVLFAPVSFLYFIFISIKNLFYKIGILKSKKANIKVICVGNLTTGGVGKTPVVIELANYLAKNNEKPAIITRGYKGKLSNNSVNVIRDFSSILINDPILSGDEPNLIAKNVENCAVLVGCDRFKLAQYAKEMGATVVIMDDGFTNRKLFKDKTILLFDYEKLIGNACLLPLGPLREPMCEIQRADKILIINKTGKKVEIDENLVKQFKYKDIHIVDIVPDVIKNQANGEILPKGEKVLAFTGIGSPIQFFNFLNNDCELLYNISFDDHYDYTQEDIENINIIAKEKGANALITTTKDYVKIKDFNSSLDIYTLELKIDLNAEGILKWD